MRASLDNFIIKFDVPICHTFCVPGRREAPHSHPDGTEVTCLSWVRGLPRAPRMDLLKGVSEEALRRDHTPTDSAHILSW